MVGLTKKMDSKDCFSFLINTKTCVMRAETPILSFNICKNWFCTRKRYGCGRCDKGEGRITSSPGPILSSLSATYRAVEPLEHGMAALALQYCAKLSENNRFLGPLTQIPESRVSMASSLISSVQIGRAMGTNAAMPNPLCSSS